MVNKGKDFNGSDEYLRQVREEDERLRVRMDDDYPRVDDWGFLDTTHPNFDKRLANFKKEYIEEDPKGSVIEWLIELADEVSQYEGIGKGFKKVYRGNKAGLEDFAYTQALTDYLDMKLIKDGQSLSDYYEEEIDFSEPVESPDSEIPLDENDTGANRIYIEARKVYPVSYEDVKAVILIMSVNGKPHIDVIFPDMEPTAIDVCEIDFLSKVNKYIELNH